MREQAEVRGATLAQLQLEVATSSSVATISAARAAERQKQVMALLEFIVDAHHHHTDNRGQHRMVGAEASLQRTALRCDTITMAAKP